VIQFQQAHNIKDLRKRFLRYLLPELNIYMNGEVNKFKSMRAVKEGFESWTRPNVNSRLISFSPITYYKLATVKKKLNFSRKRISTKVNTQMATSQNISYTIDYIHRYDGKTNPNIHR
jgi:hypothetical protein